MIEAIESFLMAALTTVPPSIERLAYALDQLALAYAETPDGEPSDDDREASDHDHATTRARIEERFPDFGFYAVVDPLAVLPEAPSVGDAVDDVSDIAGDLLEVLWRRDTLGLDEAGWCFRFGYETHWGRHLHDLRSYIHAKTVETKHAPG